MYFAPAGWLFPRHYFTFHDTSMNCVLFNDLCLPTVITDVANENLLCANFMLLILMLCTLNRTERSEIDSSGMRKETKSTSEIFNFSSLCCFRLSLFSVCWLVFNAHFSDNHFKNVWANAIFVYTHTYIYLNVQLSRVYFLYGIFCAMLPVASVKATNKYFKHNECNKVVVIRYR